MKEVKIDNNLDVIHFIKNEPDLCQGRRIFIDKAMLEKLKSSADTVFDRTVRTTLEIFNLDAEGLMRITLEKYNMLTQVVEVVTNDKIAIGEIDDSKESLLVVNERIKTFEEKTK